MLCITYSNYICSVLRTDIAHMPAREDEGEWRDPARDLLDPSIGPLAIVAN